MSSGIEKHEVISIGDDDDDSTDAMAEASTEEGTETNILEVTKQPSADLIKKTNFDNNNNYYDDEDDATVELDGTDVEERNQLFNSFNPANPPIGHKTYYIGDYTFDRVSSSSSSSKILIDDELVNTTLKFYQRADASFPSFKQALARKVRFVIPYVKQALDIEEEHALLTAEVIPLISAEMDSQKSTFRQWDLPLEVSLDRKVEQTNTFSNIEATKLFSLNLGLEKALGTKVNDLEFEEEFSKIFFSVYGEDARQILDLVEDIVSLDPPEDN